MRHASASAVTEEKKPRLALRWARLYMGPDYDEHPNAAEVVVFIYTLVYVSLAVAVPSFFYGVYLLGQFVARWFVP